MECPAGLQAGPWLKIAVVTSASALLLFAANTAMIGGYHVFLALSRDRFFPQILSRRNVQFGTPHWAILITTLVPIGTIMLTKARLNLLGDMYSFGLLGAFTFTSLGLDLIRWREKARGTFFWLGLLTTLIVGGSWAINIVERPFATAYGTVLAASGLLMALAVRRNWIVATLNRIPAVNRRAERIRRCKGKGESALYLISITEWPGLFSGAENKPSPAVVSALGEMGRLARDKGVFAIPVWAVSNNAARALADAARQLGCTSVMLGVSQRSSIYHMLRGNVLRGLARRLPEGHTIITVG